MNQYEDWVILSDRFKTANIAHDVLLVHNSLEAEATELVILNLERVCGGHDIGRTGTV
jgi:hypothetical protein